MWHKTRVMVTVQLQNVLPQELQSTKWLKFWKKKKKGLAERKLWVQVNPAVAENFI